jgi:hypothetical protein
VRREALLQMEKKNWLLLLYALPTKRTSARVNLWRKLKKFGAVQLKTSAYVLPDDAVQYERFQWLATEIRDAGGEATLIRVAQIEGMGREQIVQMFNDSRGAEYKELMAECRQAMAGGRRAKPEGLAAEIESFRRRLGEIAQIDYFHSPAGHDARMLLQRAEKQLAPRVPAASPPRLEAAKYVGRTWLTRPRPGIDRAGSAWLIRKFIDPKARFIFGMDSTKHPNALPFDMADVEFSHHGDDCTFETLVKRFGIADKAVLKMAEMVHDADLEDQKFQRSECLGINCVLSGWAKTGLNDHGLLAKGIECFEGLYQHLRRGPRL